MKLTGYLVKSTIVAALGGLLFGFDTAVIAGTTGDLTNAYHLSAGTLGFTVASALYGTIIGAMLAGFPGDRYGRRDSLRAMAVLYLVSALGCAFAWDWYSLILFRFIGGLGIGGSSVLGPMYIAEIAPAQWRGRLCGLFSIQCRVWNSARLLFELHHRPAAIRRYRMALEARRLRLSRAPVPHHAVLDRAEPALARKAAAYCGSARRSQAKRRIELRTGAAGDHPVD